MRTTACAMSGSRVAAAVRTAERADVALVFVGLPPAYESEGFDRHHMRLPPGHLALVEAVAEACERVVVVLANGSIAEEGTHDDLLAANGRYAGQLNAGELVVSG